MSQPLAIILADELHYGSFLLSQRREILEAELRRLAAIEAAAARVPLTPAQQHADELFRLLVGVEDIHRDECEHAPEDRCYYAGALGEAWEEVRALKAKIEATPQPPAAARVPLTFDLIEHLRRQMDFSARTYGPGDRTAGVCDHIRKELNEVQADAAAGVPTLPEWVDVIILGFDGAWRSGASPEQIVAAIVSKQTKNEVRRWPDWRTADPSKAIEHDRSGEAASQEGGAA